MVIHDAIDGFSRKILYLKCATNNKAATVLGYFSHAVSVFGLPDRIRSDGGGENTGVWRFMLTIMTWSLHVSLEAPQLIMRELKDCGVMCLDV